MGGSVHAGESDGPGIYHLSLSPGEAGHRHGRFTFSGEGLDESVEVHLDVYPGHEALHHEDEAVDGHGHSHGSLQEEGEITFHKEDAWKAGFRVEEVRRGPFHVVIPTSGELMPMPGEKKSIPATARGMIRFHDPSLVQGSHVKKGQHLFTISSESLLEDNVQLRREAARNRLERSRSEYLRHKMLHAGEAISEKLYQESRTAYVEDSLNYYNLEKHLDEEGIRVLAPASGSLHEMNVWEGIYVSEGQVLAVLSPDKNLMLRADLPQQHFALSRNITSVRFRPAYSKRIFSLEEMGGRLLAVGHSVMENDHYLPVNFLLPNEGELLEGAFAEVYLIADPREEVLTVPPGSLGEEQGGGYVYVQVTGESYSKRRVQTGQSDGIRIEILGGLEPGERIVTEGVMLMKAASMDTGEIAHGHSH